MANCTKNTQKTHENKHFETHDMGLTIHYNLKSTRNDTRHIKDTVHKMRQLALDLPFEEVGEIVDIQGNQCDYEDRRAELQGTDDKSERLFWLLIQASKSVYCPWNKRISRTVNPTRIIAFNTWPGHGSEGANFGLCLYPAEIEWEYSPKEDQRFFQHHHVDGRKWSRFSWDKWERYCKRHHGRIRFQEEFKEVRKVPTKLDGWRWGSFCKTQFASDPTCGGIPNFLRCHISVITLLGRMAKLPDLRVRVDDEGKYGPSTYAGDWREAHEAGRKATYRRHKGKYSPAALAEEVGEWNSMLAAFSGALSDALVGSGMELQAPITEFPNFEQLEFRGQNQKYLKPFLQAMKTLSSRSAGEEQEGS